MIGKAWISKFAAVALLMLTASCDQDRAPTDTYNCAPGCFVDCTDPKAATVMDWEVVAHDCQSANSGCLQCIERIEREGNACGWTHPCPREGDQDPAHLQSDP